MSLLILLLLNGCVQVFPDPVPPAQVYSFRVEIPPNKDWQNKNWQLSVSEPAANSMLNSRRIAIRFQEKPDSPQTWDYVKGQQWAGRLPQMIQEDLAEQLTRTQKLKGVVKESVALNANYQLLPTLYEFHIEDSLEGPNYVLIQLLMQLRDNKTQKIVASKVFLQKQIAPGKNFPTFKKAFDQAYSILIQDFLDWLLALDLKTEA